MEGQAITDAFAYVLGAMGHAVVHYYQTIFGS